MIPRSEEYLDFARGQSCSACNHPAPSDPHHVEQIGTAIKGSDYSVIPLCRACHGFLEDNGHRLAERRLGFSVAMAVAETLHRFHTGAELRFPGDLVREALRGE